jgi:membrane-associated protein
LLNNLILTIPASHDAGIFAFHNFTKQKNYSTLSHMEALHDGIIELFLNVSPLIRNILIFSVAFGEGLPIIGSILPGGTIALLIGSLAQENLINVWTAVHLIGIGSFLGDLLGFFAGRKLSNLPKIKKILESEKHIKKWDFFDRHAAIMIIFGKVVPVVRSTPSLFAGARKMNVYKYSVYVLIGSYLWAVAGIFGGKYLAQIFGGNVVPIILGILLVSAALTLFSNRKKS